MNLARLLNETARVHGPRTALLDDECVLTWSQWFDRVRRVSGMLGSLGAVAGARFGLLMKNGFRQAEALWAGHWSGAVPVPVNWRLVAREVAEVLDDAGCVLVLVDAELAAFFDDPALSGWRTRIVVVDADAYEERVARAAPAEMHDAGGSDEALVLYTGGTTGRSKGVRLSHDNLASNAMQIGLALGIRPGDVTLTVAPMFHAAALCSNITTLLGGTHVYLRQFTPAGLLGTIERRRIAFTTVVPTMLKMVLDEPDAQRFDRSSLRVLFYGSSPMPVSWMRSAMQFFPNAQFHQAYGLTETAPILTILGDDEHRAGVAAGDPAILGSAGRPLVGVELRIVDDAGVERPAGQPGEVVVRAPGVMLGYHDRPEETAAALRDGWFHTGDVGAIDADGRLTILDRKKDLIISGGENVYSVDVEAALARHPAIAEVAVIGVPDDRLGEAVAAIAVLRSGAALSVEELIAHCRASIGAFKVPRHVRFVDALPRTPVGKVQKAALREAWKK
ncbi:MAG: AMP-binding protein [Burkholderiaceae bacterium]|nr:AMP-binding protein [Burkholderiaceae bacterium]